MTWREKDLTAAADPATQREFDRLGDEGIPSSNDLAQSFRGFDDWDDPIPLGASAPLPFPSDAIGTEFLREWIEAEAKATQTPIDLAGVVALGVLASACHGRVIVTIADRLDEAAAVKTLAHELAHVLLHCGPTFAYIANRGRYECEAESVAYMVCDALGVASDAYSFGYVAHWSGGDPKVVEKAAERAMTCAREILADLSEQASEVALAA